MPLTVSKLSFNDISGPTTFYLIEPTDFFTKKFNRYIPSMLLLGDHHQQISQLCHDTDKFIGTYTTLWFRCLDSYTTKDQTSIDYFIESYFPEDLLDDPYYFQDETIKWFISSSKKTIMNVLPNFNGECFSMNSSIKAKKCMTSNINYYLVDTRLGKQFLHLHPSDNTEQDLEDLVYQYYPEYKKNQLLGKKDSKQKRSEKRKKKIHQASVKVYENIIHKRIINCLSEHRSEDVTHVLKINEQSVFDLIKMLYKNPRKCASMLFDFKNPLITTCNLYKIIIELKLSIKNIFTQQDIEQSMYDLFVDYFEYVVTTDKAINDPDFKKRLYKGMANYEDETFNYYNDLSAVRQYNVDDDQEDEDEIETQLDYKNKVKRHELKFTQYVKDTKELASTILIPFVDLFSLISSWCKPQSILSVYQCGELHTQYLRDFLVQKKYYKSIYSAQNQKQEQCLTIDFNLDEYLTKNLKNTTFNQAFKAQMKIIKNRTQILKPNLYKQMLYGRVLTKEQLLTMCNYKNLETCMHDLGLSDTIEVFVPEEYKNKINF